MHGIRGYENIVHIKLILVLGLEEHENGLKRLC